MHRKGYGAAFNTNWSAYKEGFGSTATKNFWLGLTRMHEITTGGSYGLEVTLVMDSGLVKTLTWNSFVISGESDKFRLSISGFNAGTSGLTDRFAQFNGRPFSTPDQDNDAYSGYNCASGHQSGWWYNINVQYKYKCGYSLNGYTDIYGYKPSYGGWSYYESTMTLKR